MLHLKLVLTAIFVIAAILIFKPEIAVADTAPKITVENWYWGPGNEWSYKHTRRIFPSAAVYRRTGPVTNLDYQMRDIDSIAFRNPNTGRKMTVAEMYAATNTDAFLVMKGGKIITERYFNGMRPHDTHLLMSVTKSVVGSLAGIIVEQGHLDPSALVTDYVPEVEDTAYEGATVRHVLDMSVGLDFDEDYSSKTSDLYRLDEAAGWVPRGPNASNGLHEYLTTLMKKNGQHGDAFLYASPTTDLMGWIFERATNMDFAELLSRELWSKLGAERDAYVLLDDFQNASPIPGLRARDGLAVINGSNVITAMSALLLVDTNNWLKQAEIAAAMSLEALKANMNPYTPLLHKVRGFKGAIRSAKAILKLVEGGDLVEGGIKCKMQDAYSMRSTPQVIAAVHDAVAYACSQVEIELNGVGDNPIVFHNKKLQLSGANFQGLRYPSPWTWSAPLSQWSAS